MTNALVQAKPLLESRTVWFNVLLGAPVVIDGIAEITPVIAPFLSAGVVQGIGVALVVGNIILRRLTEIPARLSGSQMVPIETHYTSPPSHHVEID